MKIGNLKIIGVNSTQDRPEVAPDYSDSSWDDAFASRDRENRIPQDSSEYVVIRGSFELPAFTSETRITMLTRSIEQVQDVYVNGRLIAKDVERDAPGQTYRLDHSFIHAGKNVYAVVGPPSIKRNRWETLNTDPGQVKMVNPAAQWKRSAFNGLAQVIVQSTEGPGSIELTATSPGLKKSTAVIRSVRSQ